MVIHRSDRWGGIYLCSYYRSVRELVMSLRVREDRHLIVSDDGVREQLDGYTQVDCRVVDSVISAVPIHSLKYF